jgi:UDP-sugar transporter A1/2/3
VLSLGVVFVTVNTSTAAVAAPGSAVGSPDWLLGMAACSASGLSSAFAGVYFERYVKGRLAASLWVRNIQVRAAAAAGAGVLQLVVPFLVAPL